MSQVILAKTKILEIQVLKISESKFENEFDTNVTRGISRGGDSNKTWLKDLQFSYFPQFQTLPNWNIDNIIWYRNLLRKPAFLAKPANCGISMT